MMTLNTGSKRLTIFEGPDGAGKTTAAKAFAQRTGARYVHFGPLFHVTTGVARMYVEAMLPALLGYQDVVFDRSWLSEAPYGNAFRNGQDRMGACGRRMLERLAMRCETLVVKCDPGWEAVKKSFETGRPEMLEHTGQLRQVYDAYVNMKTALPVFFYDYTQENITATLGIIDELNWRTRPHSLDKQSAGNLSASIILVGDSFAERKNDDAWYQWPFASFSFSGCSRWLAQTLEEAHISEASLLWLNSDMLTSKSTIGDDGDTFLALGQVAHKKLISCGFASHLVPHPQYWKRFCHLETYPLIEVLNGLTR